MLRNSPRGINSFAKSKQYTVFLLILPIIRGEYYSSNDPFCTAVSHFPQPQGRSPLFPLFYHPKMNPYVGISINTYRQKTTENRS